MRHDECMVNSFILVRHAETPYSAQGRMNPDSTVEVGLTAPGERAARGLGRDLAGERIDAVAVAPSLRTRLTAARWSPTATSPPTSSTSWQRSASGRSRTAPSPSTPPGSATTR